MKKKLCVLIIIIIAIMPIALISNSNTVYKGYSINNMGDNIAVKGTLIKDNEYNFHTFVRLGKEEPLLTSIVELNFNTQIELDKNTNTYILENPKLEITPIGCDQYNIETYFLDPNDYSVNCQFGIKPNQSFKQTMEVGIAKLIINRDNIKLNKLMSINSGTKVNSLSSLNKTADNKIKVQVDFSTLNQCYTQWFSITFSPTSYNEGIFKTS